jgi:Na+/melibiose symporter-like transporter
MYFAIGALHYSFYVYRMKFYTNYLGFREDEAGLVQAIWNVASFIGVTMWSNIADGLGAHKKILMAISLGLGGVFELVLLKNFLDEKWWLPLAVVVFGMHGLLMGGLLPLADDQILKLLTRRFNVGSDLYGRQALFGMLACGLLTFTLGELLSVFKVSILLWIVPATSIMSAFAVWTFGYTPSPIDSEKSPIKIERPKINFMTYLKTLVRPRFVFLLLTILASGFGRQVLTLFLPHYLSKDLGLSDRAIGRAYLGSSLFSILFFFISPYALSRFGVRMMLLVGQCALLTRLSIYAFLSPGSIAVPFIELLNGMAYSCTHVAAVKEAGACAPLGWEAAFQAAYGCAHVQFPAVFISLLGGYLYRIYGGRLLLTGALITPLISVITLAVILTRDHHSKG